MGYLPSGGFIHLATSKTRTVNTIKRVIQDFCSNTGDIQPFFDESALYSCAEEWQEEIFAWEKSYREDFTAATGKDSSGETLSHIKYAGVLLRAFTQCGHEGIIAASVNGILPEKVKDAVEAYPNEFLVFSAVYWLFHEQQCQRGDATLLYDPEYPPMNTRYMRAMVHYLSSGGDSQTSTGCRNSDLYLIFKTMDLYGVNASYLA